MIQLFPSIDALNKACLEKHKELGKPLGKMLSIAALVVSIYIAVVIQGFGGVAIGFATFLALSRFVCKKIHDRLQNKDYLEVSKALTGEKSVFRKYIRNKEVSLDNIVEIHKNYKSSLYRTVVP